MNLLQGVQFKIGLTCSTIYISEFFRYKFLETNTFKCHSNKNVYLLVSLFTFGYNLHHLFTTHVLMINFSVGFPLLVPYF